ncbi:hypothetical protein KY359_02885 [Candidatus Woesearchaeota archaeon]|nr:hypothetical protein [Candidatus Woesearchaeota archaeon]
MTLNQDVIDNCLAYYVPEARLLQDVRIEGDTYRGIFTIPARPDVTQGLRENFRYLATQQANTCMIQLAYSYAVHLADTGGLPDFERTDFHRMFVRRTSVDFRRPIPTLEAIEASITLEETFEKKGKRYAKFSFDFEEGKAIGELLTVFI